MKRRIELLVTDLDNTLYDWVTYFVTSFYEMVRVAGAILSVPEQQLLDELRQVHIRHHNTEQPFALLETPAVIARFGRLERQQRMVALQQAFDAFSATRAKTLTLYPGVLETLKFVSARCPVVGHTEASVPNAVSRLRKLGVESIFTNLYAVRDLGRGHPDPKRVMDYKDALDRVILLEQDERKPDPRVLIDICAHHGVELDRTLYVGDSIPRDIGMAVTAGTCAAWAKYGTLYEQELWAKLVRVTHWTKEDVERAERARQLYGHVKPHATLERSFSEILDHFEF